MVADIILDFVPTLGGGVSLGFIAGYLGKKVSKLIAVLIGAELLLFAWLESRGIITVDWERLTAGLISTGSTAAQEAPGIISSLVSTLGIGAAFTGGFALGFKKG
jgi:uncharacterized membrane protein (Fun14 family)